MILWSPVRTSSAVDRAASELFRDQSVHSASGVLRIRSIDVVDMRGKLLTVEDLLVLSVLDPDYVSSLAG